MFLRFLFFLLLFYLLYKIYFAARRPRRPTAGRGDATRGEEMVLDPQCNIYLPKSEAMLRGDQYFCSERCAALYLAGGS
ncbi:MAG TPA: PP0621 family protein [Verrucomicrobiae bacterium]|jgi:hypothetical protein|nr:PP0621 family protein [Verrucomicrobiae bacterium]